MLPFDIHYARDRYNDMLAEAQARRLANDPRSGARSTSLLLHAKSLIARVLESMRPRRAARA